MALHGELRVNGMTIGAWEATRQSHQGGVPEPDTHVIYSITVRSDSTQEGNPAVLWRGEVSHRFGDGALQLAAKALQAAVDNTDVRL